jgi:D-methionine transport system substrate-binding protein
MTSSTTSRFLRRNVIAGLAAAAIMPLLPCIAAAQTPLKIGTPAGPFGDIMAFAVTRAKAQGLDVKAIEFTDWITPNEALAAGDIDANLFQHIPFLNAAIKARGYKLVPIGATTVMPMALFSHKVKTFDQVPNGATVAIANDPVNGARGLQLFQKAGLITLTPGVGDNATVEDVVTNPKHLRFLQLEAAQLPRALDDVAVAQVSISYLAISGGDPDSALLADGGGDPHYALNFVVRADRKDDPRILQFVEIYRSPEVKAFIVERFGKYMRPVW